MRKQLRQITKLVDGPTFLRLTLLVVMSLISSIIEASSLALLFLLFKIVVSPETIAGSHVLSDLRDVFGPDGNKSFLVAYCGVLALLFLVKSGLLLFGAWLRPHIEWRVRHQLSARAFEGYLRSPYIEIARRNSSELVNNITTGVGQVAYSAIGIADLMSESLLIIIVNATLLYLQPAVTLIAIATFGLASLLYARLAQQRSRAWGRRSMEASAQVLAALSEPLAGVKQVKTSGVEAFFLHGFRRALTALGRVSWRNTMLIQALRPVLELLVALGLLSAIVYLLLSDQPLTDIIPIVALFGAAAYRLLPSVVRINQSLQALQFARPAIAALHLDLSRFRERPAVTGDSASLPAERLVHDIRLEEVSFRYEPDGTPILNGITLTIRQGESVAIVGASGAGKTTLVDIILGLIEPESGCVLIDGHLLAAEHRPRLFSYVPQDSFLIDSSLAHNIALGQPHETINVVRLNEAVKSASLAAFVEGLPEGLDTIVGERGVRLSGGQRQRIAIARAIYRGTDVLVLDESTSALDSVTEAAVAAAIQGLRGKRTLIIIAHRLSTVKNCDRLVFLRAGRIVDEGSFGVLTARNAEFREMVHEMELPHPVVAATTASIAS